MPASIEKGFHCGFTLPKTIADRLLLRVSSSIGSELSLETRSSITRPRISNKYVYSNERYDLEAGARLAAAARSLSLRPFLRLSSRELLFVSRARRAGPSDPRLAPRNNGDPPLPPCRPDRPTMSKRATESHVHAQACDDPDALPRGRNHGCNRVRRS